MAYGRALWPCSPITGMAANTSPAHSPVRRDASRRPIAAIPAAAAAMATADGSLVANSPGPATLTTGHMSR